MNRKTDFLSPFGNLTIKELTEVTQGLLLDALDAASVSRTLKPRISADLYSVPLVRDSLLSWASQAMAVRARLLFLMETSGYGSGQAVSTIGTGFTHGSVLVMSLIDTIQLTVYYTALLEDLIIDVNSPSIPETY